MVTRKSFLASGAALAVDVAFGEGGKSRSGGFAKPIPDVKFKDLQTVRMLSGGCDALKKLGSRLKHDIVFLAHHGQNGVDKDFYAAVAPEAAIWPTPSWLWENRAGKGTCGSGPWRTNYVKCWMQDLGVKKNYVLTKDYLFV